MGAERANWGFTQELLATIVDLLAVANWQRPGKKNAPKPKRIKRPGSTEDKRIGSKPIPLSEFASWWDSHDRSTP